MNITQSEYIAMQNVLASDLTSRQKLYKLLSASFKSERQFLSAMRRKDLFGQFNTLIDQMDQGQDADATISQVIALMTILHEK